MKKNSHIREGMLLVAPPYMDDHFFHRAVVLITEHNEAGTVGFILNKSLAYQVSDLLEGFSPGGYGVALGGPVGHATLNFLHTLGNVLIPKACHVTDGLYWGGDFEVLTGVMTAGEVPPPAVRFFLGYSGWTPGQLDAEIEAGGWELISSGPYDLMEAGDDFWYDIVACEPQLRPWALIPENISDN